MLTDSEKLRKLADWIDVKYPNDLQPEVQTDLRRIAAALEEAEAAKRGGVDAVVNAQQTHAAEVRGLPSREQILRGVPCSPGCQGHVSHPCEKCGQQW